MASFRVRLEQVLELVWFVLILSRLWIKALINLCCCCRKTNVECEFVGVNRPNDKQPRVMEWSEEMLAWKQFQNGIEHPAYDLDRKCEIIEEPWVIAAENRGPIVDLVKNQLGSTIKSHTCKDVSMLCLKYAYPGVVFGEKYRHLVCDLCNILVSAKKLPLSRDRLCMFIQTLEHVIGGGHLLLLKPLPDWNVPRSSWVDMYGVYHCLYFSVRDKKYLNVQWWSSDFGIWSLIPQCTMKACFEYELTLSDTNGHGISIKSIKEKWLKPEQSSRCCSIKNDAPHQIYVLVELQECDKQGRFDPLFVSMKFSISKMSLLV